MAIGKYCNRQVVFVFKDQTPLEAACIMREQHVGNVVIVDIHDGQKIPIGIVTDRDITLEIVAEEIDPDSLTVQDISRTPIVVLEEDEDLGACIVTLRREGIRRAPVVDKDGYLIGIITTDDIVDILAEHLNLLANLLNLQPQRESSHTI